jgi:hypothetical protein
MAERFAPSSAPHRPDFGSLPIAGLLVAIIPALKSSPATEISKAPQVVDRE